MNARLEPMQEEALRALIATWGSDRVVLVGGSALSVLTGMPWRTTMDIDVVVGVDALASVRRLSSHAEWKRDPDNETRWRYRDAASVDIVPVTPEVLRAGELRWPDSTVAMNTAGLDLAMDLATTVALSNGTALRVAPLPVIALVKMAAFLDRPHDRARDLADIAWIAHVHVPDTDDRRFDPRLAELGISYNEGASFALGQDLRAIVGPHAPVVEQFLRTVEADWLDVMAMRGPVAWARDRAIVKRQLRALEAGFEA